jgi:hypothetical protein
MPERKGIKLAPALRPLSSPQCQRDPELLMLPPITITIAKRILAMSRAHAFASIKLRHPSAVGHMVSPAELMNVDMQH